MANAFSLDKIYVPEIYILKDDSGKSSWRPGIPI